MLGAGTDTRMHDDPTPPASDEADPEQQTTPGGQVEELEEMIEETDAEVPDDD